MDGHSVVRFGSFEFDFATRELSSNGRRVALQDQPAQVLSELVRRPGEVVTREDLRRAIWTDGTFVDFDASVNVAVNKIRQALRDSATSSRFVETIPRRGYRFLADVHVVAAPAPSPAPAPPMGRSSRWRMWVWAATLILVVGGTVLAALNGGRTSGSTPPIRSIAVLPFRPLVAETRDVALEVGLAEAVIIRLGAVRGLRVPSIHAVQHYAQRQLDPRLAGRDLGVEAVLDGSLLRVDGNVRLSARLLDVASGTTLWAQQWDLPWTDIFTVQDALAAEVSRALAVSLAVQAQSPSRRHATNVAAYESYLRARYLLLRRTVADSRRAAELLEEAVKLDPESAAAHASLAFAYVSVPLLEGPSKPFVELGRQAALRALDLDPAMAEARAVLGRIMLHFDWDAEGAHREMRRALELDPTNPFVLHCYSLVLADEGRFEEALALGERALAQDPTSVLANRDMAIILFLARRYEACIERCEKTIELDRNTPFVHYVRGRAYEQLGQDEQAVAAYLAPLSYSEESRAVQATAARGGLEGFWERRLQSLLERPEVPTYAVASAYMRLGDHDRALAWLEKLYAERGGWIRGLRVHPEWDPLRADPRFQDLLRRARLLPAVAPVPSQERDTG